MDLTDYAFKRKHNINITKISIHVQQSPLVTEIILIIKMFLITFK